MTNAIIMHNYHSILTDRYCLTAEHITKLCYSPQTILVQYQYERFSSSVDQNWSEFKFASDLSSVQINGG